MMKPIIVFLCTPRCGTQWIVKFVSENYSEKAVVKHEPINYEYYPKLNLGRYDSPLKPVHNDDLKKHLKLIDEITKDKIYIEVGWESIAGVPELIRRFGDRIKLIHLYRNPVHVAASLVTHRWYTGKKTERHEKAELSPFDDAAILKYYRENWDGLTLFEKSLYFWTEINLRAIEIKVRYDNLSYHTMKFEKLFKMNKENSRITLIEMLSYMNLSYKENILKSIDTKIDKHQYRTKLELRWEDIYNHPQTVALANKLDYQFNGPVDLDRYKGLSLYRKTIKKLKSII